MIDSTTGEALGLVSMATEDDVNRALAATSLANRLPYGLGAYGQSRDHETVTRAVDHIQAGNVVCNEWTVTYPEAHHAVDHMSRHVSLPVTIVR